MASDSMATHTLLVRADASAAIGTGHVMRCLALAQAWQETGGLAVFVLASAAVALQARLEAEQMRVVLLAVEPGSAVDAEQTIVLARELSAGWVVVDGYQFDAAYQRALKAAGLKLLFVDDYGHAAHYAADVVLNQNTTAEEAMYTKREPYTRLLLGPRYVLMRREFRAWRGWQRELPDVGRKVLVTLGGSDPDNTTEKVVRALQWIDSARREARVVLGGSNPHYDSVQRAIAQAPAGLELLHNVTNMPDLMAWADLAVTASGSTSWELCLLGLPGLLIVLAENQRPIGAYLDMHGAAINLGWYAEVSDEQIAHHITMLLQDHTQRARLSARGQALIDGTGSQRLVAILQGKA